MSGLATLLKVAERRAKQAILDWQRLVSRRDDAEDKLVRLQEHRQAYCKLMQQGLRLGMPAAASVGHIGFIAQIEAVEARQHSEIADLEAASARHHEAVVNARREQRIYELLIEQLKVQAASVASHQLRLEAGELLQRAAWAERPISFLVNNGKSQNGRC